MAGRPSNRSLLILAGIVIWALVLVFGWATRPIEDTVPVGIDPAGQLAADLAANPGLFIEDQPVAQLVDCNSLLDTEPRDLAAALPELDAGYRYEREPCESPHRDARLAFAVNVVVIVALLAAWVWFVRLPSQRARSSADAEFAR